jgi:hypothetical protein
VSDRLEWYDIVVPANTPVTAPLTFPCVFNDGDVIEIDVKVPPGPQGNVGFFIGAGGSQYVPRTIGSFVIPDDDYFTWPLANAVTSGSWSVTAYNTDIFPHLIQVAFQVNETGTAHMSTVSLLPSSSAALPDSVTSPDITTSSAVDPLSPDALLASLPPDIAELVATP